MTSETYARRIFAFSTRSSKDSFYPGVHYAALAKFLASVCEGRGKDRADLKAENAGDFVTLHDLAERTQLRAININTFDKLDIHTAKNMTGQIMFLNGFPSPDWPCHIGARHDVDPEFFFRHFDFPSRLGASPYYCLPPLHSSTNVIQLRITSVGCWDESYSSASLEFIRSRCENEMSAYLEDLNRGKNVRLCDSIVRKFTVHDLKHFSVEQNISIYLVNNDTNWTRKYHPWMIQKLLMTDLD